MKPQNDGMAALNKDLIETQKHIMAVGLLIATAKAKEMGVSYKEFMVYVEIAWNQRKPDDVLEMVSKEK